MADFFRANTPEGMVSGLLIDFKNARLAEVYEDTVKTTDEKKLRGLRSNFNKGTVPDGCLMLTAGADYHKSERGIVRIDYTVKGFGLGRKTWTVSSGSVTSFDALDNEIFGTPFHWADPEGPNRDKPMLGVVLMFIDSGFEADEVYDYCFKRPRLTIPTKGVSSSQRTPLTLSDLDRGTARRRLNPKSYTGLQLMIVDTQFFKDRVLSLLEDEPKSEFYAEIPDYYFRELCNEHKVRHYDNYGREKWIWMPVGKGVPTHSLDTEVLAVAAGFYKGWQYWRKEGSEVIMPGVQKKVKWSDVQREKREQR
jgi:phage terminase large subunit GpA-like protein